MINKKQTNSYAAWKILMIVPIVALIFAAFSCDNTTTNTKESAVDQASPKKLTQIVSGSQNGEEVFAQVEQMPVFPGGDKAMMEFIMKELKYPESAIASGVQGTVIVRMTIDKEGKVKDAKVLKGNALLDAESLRMINSMPAWKPGKQGGQPVAVAYTLPLKFVLN